MTNEIHLMPPVPERPEDSADGRDITRCIIHHHWARASAAYVARMDVFRDAARSEPRLAKKLASLN